MKRIYKFLIIILAFFVVGIMVESSSFLTNQAKWMGIRQTGNHTDEGAVIIADTFQRVNQYPNYNIWELNYDSPESYVYAMVKYKGDLYAGTGPNGRIYIYDGDEWSLSYDSPVNEIYSLEVFGDNLYAGGGQGQIYIYNDSWSLAKSLSVNQIWSLKVFEDKLYAGTGTTGKVFVYNGSSWTESYDSTETNIYSLTVFEGKLFAGSGEGGIIYQYDGTTWSQNYDSPEAKILSLRKYKGKLYAGTGTDGEIYIYGTGINSIQLDSESGYSTNTTYSTTANPIANAFDEDLDTYAALSNKLKHLDAITGAGSPNYLDGAVSVYVSGDVAYVASYFNDALTTFNVTNASNIIHMGNISGAGSPNYLDGAVSVYVSGDVAYVASYFNDTLTTFNVTNASNIIHMGNISGAGSPNYLDFAVSVYISGDVAYVVSFSDALTTFNITNASNIIHMGNISGAGSPNYLDGAVSVYVSGDVAYVASYSDDALTTFNVTNASNIIHVDSITGAGSPNYLNGAYSVYVSGDVAYVVSHLDDALTTFDISNASNIIHVDSITGAGSPNYLRGAYSVYVSGDVAYVASEDDDALTAFQIPSDDRVVDWNFTIPSTASSISLATKITNWFSNGGCNISCYNYTGTKWNHFARRVSSSIETGAIPTDCFSGQTNLQLSCLLTNNSVRTVYGINFYGSYLSIDFTGINWSVNYNGLDENIYSLEEYNGNLYAGTGRTGGIYTYDGTTWSTDYSTKDYTPMYIRSLATYKGTLYAGTGEQGAIYSYNTNPRQEITISDINLPTNKSLPVNITTSIILPVNITNVPLPINLTNYGFKEYTTNIISNATSKSSISFNSRLEHLILTPNDTSATYRWKLTQDSDGTVIYDATKLDYDGRTGLIVNIPLLGFINISIQNASKPLNTSVKIVYT